MKFRTIMRALLLTGILCITHASHAWWGGYGPYWGWGYPGWGWGWGWNYPYWGGYNPGYRDALDREYRRGDRLQRELDEQRSRGRKHSEPTESRK